MLAVYRPTNPFSCTSDRSADTQVLQHCISVISNLSSGNQVDWVLSYSLQVIQLGVMLMQLNDTEHVGNGVCSLINVQATNSWISLK